MNSFNESLFSGEKETSFSYSLSSFVTYDPVKANSDGFVVFVKQNENKWTRFAKFSTRHLTVEEVQTQTHPSLLIFSRNFKIGDERSNLRSQMDMMKMNVLTEDLRPIPEFWLQKAIYTYNPGKLHLFHLLCPHKNVRPVFRDVYARTRKTKEKGNLQVENKQNANEGVTKNILGNLNDSTSNRIAKTEEEQDSTQPDSYTISELSMRSYFVPTPVSEYIIEKFCDDINPSDFLSIDFSKACEICLRRQKQLVIRRITEQHVVRSFWVRPVKIYLQPAKDSESEELCPNQDAVFLVDGQWFLKWKLFVNSHEEPDRFMRHSFYDSFLAPGPMSPVSPIIDHPNKESLVEVELF